MTYIAKKKFKKMAIFGPKACVNPFGKMSIFRSFELLLLKEQKGGYFFQNIVKNIFLTKIKFGKMAIFGPKAWVNPFQKMSIFRLFELLVFIAQNGVFSFQNFVKDILMTYIAEKKKFEKWPFLDRKHGLTPLEK